MACSLARSRFALDDRYALFDRGDYKERPPAGPAALPLVARPTASLLYNTNMRILAVEAAQA